VGGDEGEGDLVDGYWLLFVLERHVGVLQDLIFFAASCGCAFVLRTHTLHPVQMMILDDDDKNYGQDDDGKDDGGSGEKDGGGSGEKDEL